MSTIQQLMEQMTTAKAAVESIEEAASEKVSRVLRIIENQDFEGDTRYPWEDGSAVRALTGEHNWPSYFTTFELEGNYLVAGGMYYGSRGYSEHHTVRFPEFWTRCSDTGLKAAVQVAWSQAKRDRQAQADAQAARTVEEEKAELKRLIEKYNEDAK